MLESKLKVQLLTFCQEQVFVKVLIQEQSSIKFNKKSIVMTSVKIMLSDEYEDTSLRIMKNTCVMILHKKKINPCDNSNMCREPSKDR